MGNVMDYLLWRGDLSFQREPCNEVDNLIFSVLMYLPFEDIVSDNLRTTITLREAWETFVQLERNKDIHENHTLISDILFLFDVSWDCPEVHISGMLSAADVSAFEIILSIT